MSKKTLTNLFSSTLIFGGLAFFCLQTPVQAEETPKITADTATGSAIGTSSAETQALLENLERIARDKEQSEQIKSIYDDINTKKRGYTAQVISVKDKTVKVRNLAGEEYFLTFDKSTSLIKKGQETTADQIEVSSWVNIEDWLVVIGVEEEDQFAPRRVLISSVDLTPKEKLVKMGTVDQITKAKVTFTPKGGEDPTAIEMKIDKNTVLEDKDGNVIKVTQVEPHMQLLATGIVGSSGGVPTATTLKILSPIE